MNKKLVWLIVAIFFVVAVIALILFLKPSKPTTIINDFANPVATPISTSTGKIKITYAAHWTEKYQLEGVYENGVLKEKGLKQYLDEYMALHPDVEIDVMTIPYADYEAKLRLLSDIDKAPDIFQIYSPWGVSYVNSGIIDVPPQDIKTDVENNYISKSGVTINGEIWGIPGEVDDYSLIYNKKLFKDAGIVDANGEALAPKTWDDVVSAAKKISKKDTKGNIIRYGFAFTKGVDWAVVDPFLSLLFSNGGSYLSADNSKPMFNDSKGVEVLNSIVDLFKQGYTDANSNVWDFSQDKVVMAFVAPWTEGTFRDQMGATKFDEEVGVAPIPYFKTPGSLQYNWFVGVMNKSKNKQAAWDFLRWFTEDVQPKTGTTRYGDLLARTIKAIPDRKIDLNNNKDVLNNNSFKAPFIAQLASSTAEPNVLQAAKIKATLMDQIQAAWVGKDVTQALNDAAAKVQDILNNK